MLAKSGAPSRRHSVVTKSGGREHKQCCPRRPPPSRSGQRAEAARIHQILGLPSVEVVLRHARLGKLLPAIVLAGAERAEERVASDLLVAAGVVDLVQLVPAAELGADGVPQELHELDPLDGVHAARSPKVEVEVLAKVR